MTTSTAHRWLRLTSPYVKGEDVVALQRGVNTRLRARGRSGIEVDGAYGPTTRDAVRSALWYLGCPADELDLGATVTNQRILRDPDNRPSAWFDIANDRKAWLSKQDEGRAGFLKLVASYMGKKEDAGRQNRAEWLDPLHTAVGFNPASAPPYCAIALIALFRKAGLDEVSNSWAFTPTWLNDIRAERMGWKAVPTAQRQPGDVVLMKFPGVSRNSCDHIATVRDLGHTSEFNTSSGNAGSQDNGGGCFVRDWEDRDQFVVLVGRPPWNRS